MIENSQSLLLRPAGALDRDSCAELRSRLALAFSAGVTSVVVDLTHVTACDQTGLGVLAGAGRHLRQRGGALVLLHTPPHVERSLHLSGMGELLLLPASPPLQVSAGAEEEIVAARELVEQRRPA